MQTMHLYELAKDAIRTIPETTFGKVGIRERDDLQRLLRAQINIIAPDTLIIADESSEWEDSKRRIDLLGLDKDGNLVVFELKRTEDGGHMELQAIRYAAMVSTMSFDRAVDIYGVYLKKIGSTADPRATILSHLDRDDPDEDGFAQDVRIVLVSAEFSKELTTTVMWLNQRDLDIRCVRIKPYSDGDRVLIHVQQIIPLLEVADYQVQFKAKQQREREARISSRDYTKYDVTVSGSAYSRLSKRAASYTVVRHLCEAGVTPEQIGVAIPWRRSNLFRVVPAVLDSNAFVARLTEEDRQGHGSFDADRYFCEEKELIVCGGKTYAFSNQWGRRTEEALEALAKTFPDAKITFTPSS